MEFGHCEVNGMSATHRIDESGPRIKGTGVNRRSFLRVLTLGAGATLLAACQQASQPAPAPAQPKPTAAPKAAEPKTAPAAKPTEPAKTAAKPTEVAKSASSKTAAPAVASGDTLRQEMIAKAKQEGSLVIIGSNATDLQEHMGGFREKYPFLDVKGVDSNTSDSINRVVSEAGANNLTIDLVAVSADGQTILSDRGLLQQFEYPHLKKFPDNTQPEKADYVAFTVNPRTQGAYNTSVVPDAPNSWEEVVDPKYKGKTMISRSSEEIPARLALLWGTPENLNWDRSMEWFTQLIKNQSPSIARGYSGGVQRLAAGETGIFWFTSLGPVGRAAEKGAPLKLVAFPEFHIGYRSASIPKGVPHPAAAWLMIDHLTSPEGQFEYTEKVSAKLPLHPDAKPGVLAQWLIENDAGLENAALMAPDKIFSAVTPEVLKKSQDFYLKLLGVQ